MPRKNRTRPQGMDRSVSVKIHLEETEETLQAIRQDMVDALLVTRSNGTKVVTFNDADFPYRMMVESMTEGAVTLIPDGTIFYCNPRFSEMVQVESENLIGIRFHNLIRPEEQGTFDAIFVEAGRDGAKDEFCLKKADGTCIPVQLSMYQLGTDGVIGISIIVTDLTEHKQAQEALQKSESLFRLIATNSPDVIFAQDRDLRYTWIINSTPPISNEQVIGKTDWDLLPPEEAQRLTEFKQRILETGVSVREELLLSPSGSRRWFDAIYQPLYDPAQQIVGIICYARDVTERVHAEEKIRSLASKLTVAEQEERERISQVLHDDLQQHLFAIKVQLSMLNGMNWKEEVSSKPYFDMDGIQASLSEAIAVTRNLSVDLSPIVLDGKGLTDAITWLSSRMLEQHGLHVEVEAKDNLDRLDNHVRMLLFRSVREILFNVVKHAGTLSAKITLEKENQHARMTISDDGKGFDVATVIGDLNTAHGLLVIRDRLSLVGCNMEIISEHGIGTRIMIEAPLGASST